MGLPPPVFSPSQDELARIVRSVWVDNNLWTRQLINSILYNFGNRQSIKNRLEKTAEDFENLYTQYYGEQVGKTVKAIYIDYLRNLELLIEAYRDNNREAIENQRQDLYNIADTLAEMFSHINRYWDRATLQALLYDLISSTENQIISILTQDYESSIKEIDRNSELTYILSDVTASGMLRQFSL